MLIIVGSTNTVKKQATVDVVKQFTCITEAHVHTLPIASGVSAQPLTLTETFAGAKNRALGAYQESFNHHPNLIIIGVGIEGGLMECSLCTTGYMNICAACLYDGQQFFYGMSSGFEHPAKVIDLVLDQRQEVSEAYVASNLFHGSNVTVDEFRQGQGAIGFMTLGKLNRKEYCAQALLPALSAYILRTSLSDCKMNRNKYELN